jgi:eukaryotic-like serine/threonine-protein kinase
MNENHGEQSDSFSGSNALSTLELLPDRYQYQKTLGNKAGRTTILALDQQTKTQVVIKLLTFSDEFQWEDLRLFEREMATLRSLDHPAIPRYLDSFETEIDQGKSIALVQNYIPAQSLEEYLQAGRQFDEAEVWELLNALLDILVYLHDRHPPVIHRDIKPSNILLGDRSGNSIGQVYLVDFGSVQTLATRAGQTMTVVGTYGYMPPEQFGGSAVPASDIYSLGCTALRLITGSHPGDLPQRDLQIQFTQYTDLSPSFTTWLQKATHPSLDQRFSQALTAKEILNQSIKLHQALSPLLPQLPMTTQRLFWNFLWRSTVLGTLTGGIYGGVFGTVLFYPGIGTLMGVMSGVKFGLISGLFNGLISAACTHFLSNKEKYYPYYLGLIGFFGGLTSLIVVVSTLSDIPSREELLKTTTSRDIPILIAALSMGVISYYLARWHQKKIG